MIPPFTLDVRILDVADEVRFVVSGVELVAPAMHIYTEDGSPVTVSSSSVVVDGMWLYGFTRSQNTRQLRATLWAVYEETYLLSVDEVEGEVGKRYANTPSGAPLVAGEQDLVIDVGAWLWSTTKGGMHDSHF